MKSLEERFNERGFKKYSKINPLLLQSEALEETDLWLVDFLTTQKFQSYEEGFVTVEAIRKLRKTVKNQDGENK